MSADLESLGSSNYHIYVKDGYVQLHSNGAKDPHFATNLWRDVVKTCESHNIYRILGITNTASSINVDEVQGVLKLAKYLGLDKVYKMAWVELNPKSNDIVEFTENVLSSKAINVRSFDKVEKAKDWLFSTSQ
ncbi:MAG: hypothetical protein OER83_06050 [Flavobacteriaceae bacterium]|nr:hypothetical protein [Flavobacteriaceae bacterium]MDH3796416.1 hypothetical protein [Flavobacteriaceae bacterium]